MRSSSSPMGALVLVGMALAVLLTAYTRLPAPWRVGVTNDEMLHLESFRNHYRTDDIYPVFVRKVELAGREPMAVPHPIVIVP